MTGKPSRSSYDAIIVGGGHNGLCAAAYLARAGRKVLVLERRHLVGGAAVSEEIHPGFTFSVCSYVVSLLRPHIVRELDLAKFGLELIPLDCSFSPQPDGRSLARWGDRELTRREISKFSPLDAERYPDFGLAMTKLAYFAKAVVDSTAPDPASLRPSEVFKTLRLGKAMRDLDHDLRYLNLKLMTMSAADFLDMFFESDVLKATMSVSGIIGTFLGVRSPGTAYVLLHHYLGEIDGAFRAWGFAKGGTGSVSRAFAASAESHGTEIVTSAPVERVLIERGRAAGVVLESGDEIRARAVLSGVDPHRTFLKLVGPQHLDDEFATRIRNYKMRGSSGKVNLALDRLPEFTCRPGDGPHLQGDIAIAPGTDYLERAYDEAKYGAFSSRPYLNVVIPSLVDPSVAPPGKHVMSIFVQYAPYHLAQGAQAWPEQREAFGDAVIDTLAEYCPTLKDAILHRQVLTPWDLEHEFGLTEGNIFHGELSLEQLAFLRPTAGWSRYRTPVRNLWMAGSGTHPGGGIMAAPGELCAKTLLASGGAMTAAVVIGAGLNGLTCAALLARKGMDVVVVEARDRVGGIASAHEFHPGFRSAGILHDTTGIRPRAVSALSLEQHGLRLRARRPDVAALGNGGETLIIPGGDAEPTVRKHLGRAADGYLRYRAALAPVRGVLAAFVDEAPMDVIDLESLSKVQVAWRGFRIRRLGRREMMELLRLPPMSVADWLGEFIDSQLLRAALAMPAVAGSFLGPHSPGSTANLLLAEAAAGPGVHGGGAAIAAALERAATAAGVVIRTGARVARISTEAGKVTGVELAGGERIAAGIVAASCHPRTTLLDLLPPAATTFRLRERIASFRSRGTTAQVLLAVDRKIELPGGAEIARTGAHVDDIERAFDQAKHRRFPDACVVEIMVPSNSAVDVAPAGSSVVSVLCHFAPYAVDGGWTDEARERLGRRVVDIVEQHVPDVAGHVVGKHVMVPPDLEREYGLVGGNLHHGEHGLDQILVRPIPECSSYRTPVAGLFLCGSGSHPGGGLTCATGLLAADQILSR